MRIGIIGDSHFGFGYGTEREEDSFDQAREAFEKIIAEKPNVIILTGDTFDSPIPRQDVLGKAAEILTLPLLADKSRVEIADFINKPRSSIKERICFAGIPIVAIHGTHERRPKGQPNPIAIFEKMGLVTYLQASGIVLEAGNKKVAIQGMGGVPERFVKEVFKKWDPKPVKDAFNILVFHQAVKPFLYTGGDEEFVMGAGDLPHGFDVYVDGHIHTGRKAEKIIFSGSTIITQQRKDETGPKKVWMIELDGGPKIREIPLEKGRPFFYDEMDATGKTPQAVEEECTKIIQAKKTDRKPMIKIKITGKLASGFQPSDLDVHAIAKSHKESIVSFEKKLDEDRSAPAGVTAESRASIEETMMSILKEMLEKDKFDRSVDFEEIYSLLADDKIDEALAALMEVPA